MAESTEGKTNTPFAMTAERIAEIRERVEKASRHIGDICAGRVRWKMTVPVDEERDSDLVLSNSLQDVFTLLAEVEQVSRDLAEARAELATMTAVAESNQRAHAYAVQEIQRLRAAHPVRCPEVAPALVSDGLGCGHLHRCIHPARVPEDVVGFVEHRCECGMTWTLARPEEIRRGAPGASGISAGSGLSGAGALATARESSSDSSNVEPALSPVDVPAQPEADR